MNMGVLIEAACDDDIEFAAELGAFSIHPNVAYVDRPFIRAAQAKGFRVFVYTVDLAEDIDRMFRLGADGVFTNFPERVIEKFPQPCIDSGWG